jgi:5-methylcytosine-specific restriction enzyme subunit McrC
VALSYDDFTADIPENRLLLTATHTLRHLSDLQPRIDDPLRDIEHALTGVTFVGEDEPMPRWIPTRLNHRYHRALGLAALVLRGESYELDKGYGVRTDGLLMDMSGLYEDFVTVALERALVGRYGGNCRINKYHNLDRSGRICMRPDLVYCQDSKPVAVADAKYIVSPGPYGLTDNMYQVVSYCAGLNVRRGFLIYAEGSRSDPVPHVIGDHIEITPYHLDLTQAPPALIGQIDDLAGAMTGH